MPAKGSLIARGSYILIMRNRHNLELEVGKLGRVQFERGYYVYVGSGLGGVYQRARRHMRRDKKKYWHIDYLTPEYMSIKRIYIIRSGQSIEEILAQKIEKTSCSAVVGFGSSDSPLASHLFFFASPPHRKKSFMDIVHDFKAENMNLH